MTENTKLIKSTPKDFFLYLLAIFTLYLITTNMISLLFSYIDQIYHGYERFFEDFSIRWNIASLIVALPVFIYTLFHIKKDTELDPSKQNLRIRKWLLGLTLFLAVIILMSDVGTLLFKFLGGELTMRFILKTVVVFVIIGYWFYFFLHEIKHGWTTSQLKWRLLAISLVCLAILIKGFWIVGSPFKAQKQTLDAKKIADLRNIQYQIMSYWRNKQKLPDNLDQLTDNIMGYKAPLDPESYTPYTYKKLSPNSFQLCAIFKLEKSSEDKSGQANPQNWNWDHPAGYNCFIRTIDPELHKQR